LDHLHEISVISDNLIIKEHNLVDPSPLVHVFFYVDIDNNTGGIQKPVIGGPWGFSSPATWRRDELN
jgi:hypothetical protein